MSHIPTLITDLALILICAGVMTLLFKKLKQPLVLGYIVAGFLASPHMPYTPSVVDAENIRTWADIGVIFLLFALGLEFSIKKILKVGGSAIIATCIIIFCMMMSGMLVGLSFGWGHMDCLFLGGMIAMSSTTIIYKAFDDLGMRNKQFSNLVLSILILEDILAIVLMVVLSTLSARSNFEGLEMIESLGKLIFFLILWFVVGIYLIPGLLKKCRKLMTDETMLIVSLALCLGMVVFAAKVGFSPAFGAFVMGSILAETVEAENIDRLIKPVKDLFGAVFFVSVGMMVDPVMIVEYAWPIIIVTLTVLLGQALFGTLGVLLSGQPLRVAMQCGFSLTQIGEFAFIIASLGVSMHVTSNFLYPIVVAVSVITTFITPYMIRLAEPASEWVDNYIPQSWHNFLERYSSGAIVVNRDSFWRRLLLAMIRIVTVYSIVSAFIITLSFRFVVPFLRDTLPGTWGDIIGALLTILLISPFLRAIMIKKNHSKEFVALWSEHRSNHPFLIGTIIIRVLISVVFIMFILVSLIKASIGLFVGITIFLIYVIVGSRRLKKQSILIERRFFQNLRSRDIRDEYLGAKKPRYAGRLLTRDIHLTDLVLPGECVWTGNTLAELNFGKTYGIHVVSILRGHRRINIPGGSVRLYPQDKIQVVGTDEQLNIFSSAMLDSSHLEDNIYEKSEMELKQVIIGNDSFFLGKTIKDAGIRENYHCLVVGIERNSDDLKKPNVHIPLCSGDVLWVVGEKDDVYHMVEATNC